MAVVNIESLAGSRDGVRILRLSGPFTMEGVFAFESAINGLSDRSVIIDLTDVGYMDSCALGSLMGLHRPSELRQRYAVVGASERLQRMFRVARVDKILAMCPSVDEAEQKLGAKAAGK